MGSNTCGMSIVKIILIVIFLPYSLIIVFLVLMLNYGRDSLEEKLYGIDQNEVERITKKY